jgi:carboxymethylenebutenolidase
MGWAKLGGETVELRSGDATIRGYLARPAEPGRYPALVSIHGIGGLADGNRRAMDRFADAGYVALAIDWKSHEPNPHDRVILQYVGAALEYLRAQPYVDPERLAVSGYCRGGSLSYVALAELPGLRAAVSFHGTLKEEPDPIRLSAFPYVERIQAPLLELHGAADDVSPVEITYRMAQRLAELGKRFELKVYSDAGHAFALPDGSAYDPVAAADSLEEAIRFLDRYLRADQPTPTLTAQPTAAARH